mmetsp:Transcript_22156/g.71290  ORF Transcript_22156/g.71290 Transcript_22156/m.71290 type:complete len:220 (+) Transcript_22156:2054-2713(+)
MPRVHLWLLRRALGAVGDGAVHGAVRRRRGRHPDGVAVGVAGQASTGVGQGREQWQEQGACAPRRDTQDACDPRDDAEAGGVACCLRANGCDAGACWRCVAEDARCDGRGAGALDVGDRIRAHGCDAGACQWRGQGRRWRRCGRQGERQGRHDGVSPRHGARDRGRPVERAGGQLPRHGAGAGVGAHAGRRAVRGDGSAGPGLQCHPEPARHQGAHHRV